MENTQNPIVYAVNSDLDDGILYAEFATAEEAIEYAKQHMDKLPFVDELEVSYDANGEIDNVFSYKTWRLFYGYITESPKNNYILLRFINFVKRFKPTCR